jgi:ribonuclease T1
MHRLLARLLFAVGLLLAFPVWSWQPVHAILHADNVALGELPPEAALTLERIKLGRSFPYRKDDSVFQNREGRLPPRTHGYYREYTVPTPGVPGRGARRIVAGRGATGDVRTSGEYYFTGDHYRTFRRIKE